jgi:hypothetical protein
MIHLSINPEKMSQIGKYLANYLHLGARLGLVTNVSRIFWDFFMKMQRPARLNIT